MIANDANRIWQNTALIILGKIHFLLISENEFFMKKKCDGRTNFMDVMRYVMLNFTSQLMYDLNAIFNVCHLLAARQF